jgi:two-component system CheB/CheR fusion protein
MRHDLLRDPLYTKLDAILCRNILLYFNTDVRRRLLQGFHYALHAGALLALGASEMITDHDLGFEPVSIEMKTYQRVALVGGGARTLHPWLSGGCTPVNSFLR